MKKKMFLFFVFLFILVLPCLDDDSWTLNTPELYVGIKSQWINNTTWTHIDTPTENHTVVTEVDFWGVE